MALHDPQFGGINHLALVCRTWPGRSTSTRACSGMPLVKTIELPQGMGQHFFFDCGGGDCLAFFWFADAPPPAPGLASAGAFPGVGELATAIGSMNHVAFSVPSERIEGLRRQLLDHDIECTEIFNHDDSEWGVSREVTDDVFVRSVYFFDPDGILLEFACLDPPADAGGRPPRPADGGRGLARRSAAGEDGAGVVDEGGDLLLGEAVAEGGHVTAPVGDDDGLVGGVREHDDDSAARPAAVRCRRSRRRRDSRRSCRRRARRRRRRWRRCRRRPSRSGRRRPVPPVAPSDRS